jgi:hypothetical protein
VPNAICCSCVISFRIHGGNISIGVMHFPDECKTAMDLAFKFGYLTSILMHFLFYGASKHACSVSIKENPCSLCHSRLSFFATPYTLDVRSPSCGCDSVCQEQEGKGRPGPEKGKDSGALA